MKSSAIFIFAVLCIFLVVVLEERRHAAVSDTPSVEQSRLGCWFISWPV